MIGRGDGGCGVDYDGGPDFLEDGADGGGGGYVGGVVGGVGEAVVRCAQVEYGDGTGGRREELGDDVVAEETAAADYEDGGLDFGGGGCGHCGRLSEIEGLVLGL